MTRVTLHQGPEAPTAPVHGRTTLKRYLESGAHLVSVRCNEQVQSSE
jgi:hypothetical protein